MGWAITRWEPIFRKRVINELWAGTLFTILLVATTGVIVIVLLKLLNGIHLLAGLVVQVLMLYYCLSIKSLISAAMEIYHLLNSDQIDSARRKVALIVGRDVTRYKKNDIARATVETVAENFVDGVVAPLFFAAIGGAPMALAYKMINTLDSMVGYKNSRYRLFGKFAARLDDIANYLPARLSVPVIALAARMLCGRCWQRALKTALKEGRNHASPNAGYPEAAFAGTLAVKLGGPNIYHGQLMEKPYIGTAFGKVTPLHIPKACHLMLLASMITVLCAWGGYCLFN
jgi:adenosylcobinamide-phosphate synthase